MPPLPRNCTRTYLPMTRVGSFIASMTSGGGLRWPLVPVPAGLGLSPVGLGFGRWPDGDCGLDGGPLRFADGGVQDVPPFEEGGVICRGVMGPAGLGLS